MGIGEGDNGEGVVGDEGVLDVAEVAADEEGCEVVVIVGALDREGYGEAGGIEDHGSDATHEVDDAYGLVVAEHFAIDSADVGGADFFGGGVSIHNCILRVYNFIAQRYNADLDYANIFAIIFKRWIKLNCY